MNKLMKVFDRYYTMLMGMGLFLYLILNQVFRLQYHGRYVYLFLANILCLGIVTYAVVKKKSLAARPATINLLLVSWFAAACSSIKFVLPINNLLTSIVSFLQFLVLYVIASYVDLRIREGEKLLPLILTALRTIILMQCIFIIMQFLAKQLFDINLNKLIFDDLLGIELQGIWYRDTMLYTGFTYSPPLLAPMFIMGILLFKNVFIKLFIAACTMICRSSTSMIGAALCLFLLFVCALATRKVTIRNIKKTVKGLDLWQRLTFVVVFVVVVGAVFASGFYKTAAHEVSYLYQRLTGYDKSTAYHLAYFSNWFEIWSQSSKRQIIFGYGNDCSGLPMWSILGNKLFPDGMGIVECDYVETALSRGILGLIATYSNIIYIFIKGRKVDYRYPVFAVCYLVMSLGYNLQWQYHVFFMFLLVICLREQKDIFKLVDEKRF